MKNHTNSIILPSEFTDGTILRWLNSHHTLSGYNREIVILIITCSQKGYVN